MISVATATDDNQDSSLRTLPQATYDPSDKSLLQFNISPELNDAITKNNFSLASILMDLQSCQNTYHLQCTLALIIKHLKQENPRLEQLKAESKATLTSLQLKAADIRSKTSQKALKRPIIPQSLSDATDHRRTLDTKDIIGEFDGSQIENDDLQYKWTALLHIGQAHHYQEADYITSLLTMCKGTPLKQVLELIKLNYSLEDILHFLETVYINPKPASIVRNASANTIRNTGEHIQAFAARLELAIELTRSAYPEMTDLGFHEHKSLIVKQRLLDSTTPDIKRDILQKEEESIYDTGTPWQTTSFIQHIAKLEKRLPMQRLRNQANDTHNDPTNMTIPEYSESDSSDIDSHKYKESPSWNKTSEHHSLPTNNATPYFDSEDDAPHYTPEAGRRPRSREMTSASDKAINDSRLLQKQHQTAPIRQPTIHIQTNNPAHYVQGHHFSWNGQTLSIKDRRQVIDPPQHSVPEKSIPEVTIITDNPQKFVETHSLSLRDGNLLIKPSNSHPDPPATYIEIASMNTQTRNPEIPYIHLGISAPNGKHSPLMLRAMHDSGCAKSVIRRDIFESIPGFRDIQVIKLKNVFLKSCSGEKKPAADLAFI